MPYGKVGPEVKQNALDKYMDDNFTYDDFEAAAKKNGWLAPGQSETDKAIDEGLLKHIWNSFLDYSHNYENGINKIKSDNAKSALDMFDDAMNTTVPKDNKYTSKYNYYLYLNIISRDDKTRSEIKDLFDNHLSQNYYKEYYSNPERRNDITKSIPSSLGRRQRELLTEAYDNSIDKDGKIYRDINELVKKYSEQEYSYDGADKDLERDQTRCLTELKDELLKIPEDKRTDKQKDIIDRCTKLVEIDIPYEKERSEWRNNIINNNGFYTDHDWLNEFYDMKEALKDQPDHPFHKVIEQIEEGRVPQYPDVDIVNTLQDGKNIKSNTEYTYLITNQIFENAKEALEGDNSPEKANLLNKIQKFKEGRPEFDTFVAKQRTAAPYEFSYQKLDANARKQIVELGNYFETVQNDQGNGNTQEFRDMVNAMKEFDKKTNFYFRQGHDKMAELDHKVQAYVFSEQDNPGNVNAPIALYAMDLVNPKESAKVRQDLAKNIYNSLANTKKEWYDKKNTDEFNKMMEVMKEFSETDPASPEYQEVSERMAEKANYYMVKKGGLGKEAVQAGGEERRQLALLAYSLVRPEEAKQIALEANKTRSHKIDLEELKVKTAKVTGEEHKTRVQNRKTRKEAAKQSRLNAQKHKQARKAAKNAAKNSNEGIKEEQPMVPNIPH